MERLFAHIFVAVITFFTVFLIIIIKSRRCKNDDLDTDTYKGYVSKISKPKILKNDLFANWIYEYREQKAKDDWLASQEAGGDEK